MSYTHTGACMRHRRLQRKHLWGNMMEECLVKLVEEALEWDFHVCRAIINNFGFIELPLSGTWWHMGGREGGDWQGKMWADGYWQKSCLNYRTTYMGDTCKPLQQTLACRDKGHLWMTWVRPETCSAASFGTIPPPFAAASTEKIRKCCKGYWGWQSFLNKTRRLHLF